MAVQDSAALLTVCVSINLAGGMVCTNSDAC